MATVNDLACRGLDKLEEKLPFLHEPSETVPGTTGPRGPAGVEREGRGPWSLTRPQKLPVRLKASAPTLLSAHNAPPGEGEV